MKNKTNIILTCLLALFIPFAAMGKGSSSFSSSRSSGFSSSRSSGFSSSRSSGFSSSRSSSSSGFSSSRSSSPSYSKPSIPSSSSGFSSSRSSSSSSSSKPSTSSSSSWWGSTPSKPKTSFDHAQQRQNIQPPKPVKPKEQYVSDFKRDNAAKYPTTFETPPAVRPTYIPQNTVYNGTNRPIDYNPTTKSYGFFDDFGKFIVYDALVNLATKSFDHDQKVYVQAQSQYEAAKKAPVVTEEEDCDYSWVFILIFVGVIMYVVYVTAIRPY